MKLEKYRLYDSIYIRCIGEGKQLFNHCTCSQVVTTRDFNNKIWPLLRAHGVHSYSIDKHSSLKRTRALYSRHDRPLKEKR